MFSIVEWLIQINAVLLVRTNWMLRLHTIRYLLVIAYFQYAPAMCEVLVWVTTPAFPLFFHPQGLYFLLSMLSVFCPCVEASSVSVLLIKSRIVGYLCVWLSPLVSPLFILHIIDDCVSSMAASCHSIMLSLKYVPLKISHCYHWYILFHSAFHFLWHDGGCLMWILITLHFPYPWVNNVHGFLEGGVNFCVAGGVSDGLTLELESAMHSISSGGSSSLLCPFQWLMGRSLHSTWPLSPIYLLAYTVVARHCILLL